MTEENILAQEKPKSIRLADGKEYSVPPIDLTTLANMEKVMGFSLNKVGIKLESESVTTLRLIIFALLKENQPDLTVDQVGRLITLKEIGQMSTTIAEIMAISG